VAASFHALVFLLSDSFGSREIGPLIVEVQRASVCFRSSFRDLFSSSFLSHVVSSFRLGTFQFYIGQRVDLLILSIFPVMEILPGLFSSAIVS
jgi:hypothetical protein